MAILDFERDHKPTDGFTVRFEATEYFAGKFSQRAIIDKNEVSLSLYDNGNSTTIIDAFVGLLLALDFQEESIQRALSEKAFDLKRGQ